MPIQNPYEPLPPNFSMKLGMENHQQNMADFSRLMSAKESLVAPIDETPILSTITADSMRRWNKLIDFSKAKGYAGKAELDHDAKLRKKVFDEYNKANPDDAIQIDTVKLIQNEIQAYKQKALADIRSNPESYGGKPETFMQGISQVDGIFGQKTSQWKFPEAYIGNRMTGEKKSVGFAPKVDLVKMLK